MGALAGNDVADAQGRAVTIIGIDFTPREHIPLWKTAVAWIVLIAVMAGCVRMCVVPVLRPLGEAMQKQLEERKSAEAAK